MTGSFGKYPCEMLEEAQFIKTRERDEEEEKERKI